MPIQLWTGLPGAGKTLGAVEKLMDIRKREPHRPVKVLGITDLREDLGDNITAQDFIQWKDFPAGTIVIVDEVQKYMPVRRAGDPPRWIADLSEHRHLGLDFIFITQHPALIDPYVRRLIDRHIHTVRKFGTHWVERWSWPELQADPTSRMSMRAVEGKTRHKYSKVAMQAYTSSELHTVKRTVPRFIYVAGALLFVIPALAYTAWRVMKHSETYVEGNRGVQSGQVADVPGASRAPASSVKDAPLSPADWSARMTPRVAGVPWSAPMWDNLAPTTVPDLYCMVIEREDGTRDCRCVTEQVTRVDVESNTCFRMATDGVYNPFRRKDRGEDVVRRREGRSHVEDAAQVAPVAGAWPAGVGAQAYTAPGEPGSWNPDALGGSK